MKTKQPSMPVKKFSLSIVLIFSAITYSLSQNSSGGMELVHAYHRIVDNVEFPKQEQAYRFVYHIKNEYRDNPDKPVEETDMEIIMMPDKMFHFTKDIDIYRGDKVGFMVIHPQKIIYQTNSYVRPDKEQIRGNINSVRDTILDLCTVQYCTTVKVGDREYIVTRLIPNEKAQEIYRIASLEYWYDKGTEQMSKVITDLTDEHNLKRTTTIIKEFNLKYKTKYSKTVTAMIFDKNKRLLPKYSGYQLIDNRQ